jgi:hypothetical protein
MDAGFIGWITFGCLFGAVLVGFALRATLPQHHLSDETKDSVKVGMGLVATMAALLLGLLVASAKGSYDNEKNEITQMSARIVYLDRVLANFGPEAGEDRRILRDTVQASITRMWPDKRDGLRQGTPGASWTDSLLVAVHRLDPQSELQRSLKATAIDAANELVKMRWLVYEQAESSISLTMLSVVIGWLAVVFLSFGLFAPRNATAFFALFLAAASVAAAIFLILELDLPFDGIIQISSAPLRNALAHLGQ